MPSRRYDLHTHSTVSDGTLTPADLVSRAVVQGVDVLSLTDHDATDGLDEARAAAERHGIRLVPGVEISVSWEGATLHIVGLGIAADHDPLVRGLADLRERRRQRGLEIGARLEAAGVSGAVDGAAALASGPVISRTHFARFLVQQGHAQDLTRAFKRFLHRGGPGYVGGEWAGLGEAVSWINDAGGVAVIAHPGRYRLGSGRLRRLCEHFRELGGEAIEVVSGSQHASESPRLARLATEAGLAASVGSDYHGPEQRWLEPGRIPGLPGGCRPVWEHPALAEAA
jgi:predicted metal-dependent phosphoesterase TrpH